MFEWITENSWALWLAVVLVFVLIESLTVDLWAIMLAGGALAALAASFFGIPFAFEVFVFLLVSIILVWALRPVAMRHLTSSPADAEPLGVKSYPGRTAVVTEELTADSGYVRFEDAIWSARIAPGAAPLAPGTSVIIDEVDGAMLRVSRNPEQPSPLPTRTDNELPEE